MECSLFQKERKWFRRRRKNKFIYFWDFFFFQNWKAKRFEDDILTRCHLFASFHSLFKALSFPVPLVLTSLFLSLLFLSLLSLSLSESESLWLFPCHMIQSLIKCRKRMLEREKPETLEGGKKGFHHMMKSVWEKRERRKRERKWWLSVLFLKYTKDEGEKVL